MKIDKEQLIEYLKSQGPNSKIYMGADSERVNESGTWFVDYLLVLVVHIDGKHGGKVFGEIQRERDYDKVLSRPKMRLMTEVMKISQLYLDLYEIIGEWDVEIHLDINSSPIHGSSCAMSEAIGYVKGVCGIDTKIKPDAWCGSIVADSVKRICK